MCLQIIFNNEGWETYYRLRIDESDIAYEFLFLSYPIMLDHLWSVILYEPITFFSSEWGGYFQLFLLSIFDGV